MTRQEFFSQRLKFGFSFFPKNLQRVFLKSILNLFSASLSIKSNNSLILKPKYRGVKHLKPQGQLHEHAGRGQQDNTQRKPHHCLQKIDKDRTICTQLENVHINNCWKILLFVTCIVFLLFSQSHLILISPRTSRFFSTRLDSTSHN